MWFAPRTARPWAAGAVELVEDREQPPSRAYRKLQEALLLLGRWPGPGDSAWDLGAAPGAWTWVLSELGAEVHSIDKAELDPAIAARANVHHRVGSAFALDPQVDATDWLCSDVICYPERLVTLLERWLAHDVTTGYIVTIKFQGEPDPASLVPFKNIPNSVVVHLHHNKHEVTWIHHRDLQPGSWPWLPPA